MKRFRAPAAWLLCLLLLGALTGPALAAGGGGGYTYTVRFFAGGQGSFGGSPVIVMEGLRYGQQVSFSNSMVTVENSGKYYVKGIREAGKDNNTVSRSSFPVTGDADYVVAYGILGDAVAYTVNYEDNNGNPLQPDDGYGNLLPSSEVYYGNVGDRVIVAYRQVVGYQPQAYNLSKTLSENAAENVFTFVYTPIPAPPGPAAPDDGNPDGPVGGGGGGGGGDGDAGGAPIPEDEIPAANTPDQIVDLDENDTPMGLVDIGGELAGDAARLLGALPLAVKLGLAGVVLLAAGLAVWAIGVKKKKKDEA